MTTNYSQKKFPEYLRGPVEAALSYFPRLKTVPIQFKVKDNLKGSFMKAQPVFKSLFKAASKREYVILISKTFDLGDKHVPVEQMPEEILLGWIGHELGHIMDYLYRDSLNLLGFAMGYVLSKKSLQQAETRADMFAIKHGLADQIIITKEFILNNAALSEKYLSKIRRLYLSPEEVLAAVKELRTS